jgi:hypothetical protein
LYEKKEVYSTSHTIDAGERMLSSDSAMEFLLLLLLLWFEIEVVVWW